MAKSAEIHDIRAHGAVGDGTTVNTVAIQAAIDDCAQSGGTVLVPGGRFVTGSLVLRSGVELRLEPDATLLGSTDIRDYRDDTFKNMYKDEAHMDPCLLYAEDCEDVSITGSGTIDGQGGVEFFPNAEDARRRRPMLIRLVRCRDVTVRGVTLKDPAAWTSAFLYCSDIEIEGVTVSSRANQNGDGFDFDGCTRVRVSHCRLDTSDDSICVQTSRPDSPSRDIHVSRCTMSSRWAGIRVGLLSRGLIDGVVVEECLFSDIGDAAVKIQECEGGALKNVVVRRCRMRRVVRPLFVVLCQQRACVDAPPGLPPLGSITGVTLEDLDIDVAGDASRGAMFVTGHPDRDLGEIRLSRIRFRAPESVGDGSAAVAVAEFVPDLLEDWWPEVDLLGVAVPATALFARHVASLAVVGLRVEAGPADGRPAVIRPAA